MKTFILTLAAGFALTGCSAPETQRESHPVRPDTPVLAAAPPPKDSLSWVDHAVMRYLHQSNNEIIAGARTRGQDEEWIIDRDEIRDSTNYLVVHIGHDEAEADGSEQRFATDGWLYLDTLRKRIYEYDLPNDSLVFWK